MRVSILTALDQARIPASRVSDTCFQIICPACASKALAMRSHIQCTNSMCRKQTFSAEDILTLAAGGYREAATEYRELTHMDGAVEQRRRSILDAWLGSAMASEIHTRALSLRLHWEKAGFSTPDFGWGSCWLREAELKWLVQKAVDTGATIAQPLLGSDLPQAAWAVALMSCPTEISSILVFPRNPAKYPPLSIRWRPARFTFAGLLGLHPTTPRYVTYGVPAAGDLYGSLTHAGLPQPVVAATASPGAADARGPEWDPEANQFVAVVEGAADIVGFSGILRQRPAWMPAFRATLRSGMPELSPSPSLREPPTFSKLRTGYLAAMIGDNRMIPMSAVRLLEQMTLLPGEVHALHQVFNRKGRYEIVAQLQRIGRRRVIEETDRIVIRETADSYDCETATAQTTIANFALELEESVMFDERQDSWIYGKVRFNGDTVPVVCSSQSLNNPQMLQEAVRGGLLRNGRAEGYPQSPTVIDTKRMRDFVIPYLKRTLSQLPLVEGSCRLGWSADRHTYHAPGFDLTPAGATPRKTHLHPDIATLALFRNLDEWNSSPVCTGDECEMDLLAMIAATIVRSFLRMPTLPVCVKQGPRAALLVDELCRATGQRALHEFSGQQRSPSLQISGVHGYPMAAVGVPHALAINSGLPCVILVDQGIEVPDAYRVHGESLRRNVQACLLATTQWCLSGAAAEFKMMRAVDPEKQLRKEGALILEHLTGSAWPVRGADYAVFEHLLARLSLAQVSDRLTLEGGTSLVVDLTALEDVDTATLAKELAVAGCQVGSDLRLRVSAAPVLPMIERFYGQAPEVNVVA